MRDVLRGSRRLLIQAVPLLTMALMFGLDWNDRGIKWSWF
jgi:hypothetical protein